MFYDVYGAEYDQFNKLLFDPEEKITEFNYENFLSPETLKGMDTQSDEFKHYVRTLNFNSKTKYELHCDQQ